MDKEIVARFVAEHLLTDVDVMRRVVQSEGRGFAEKLHDAWNAFVTKIKSAFGEKTDAETKAQLDMLERGRAMLAEVIKSEDTGKSGGVRYAEKNPTEDITMSDVEILWTVGNGKAVTEFESKDITKAKNGPHACMLQ